MRRVIQKTVVFYSSSYLIIFLLISTFTCVCNGYFFGNWEHDERFDNVIRIRRQSPCGTSDFQCKSGQCIDEGNLCDGKPDCNDNSDETREVCGGLACSKFSFRCDYGACLSNRVRCNGQNECFDGSDEYPSTCDTITSATPFPTTSNTTTTTITKTLTTAEAQIGSCVVPNYPENGKFVIGGMTVPSPGQRIPNYGVIFTECKKRFKPYPNVFMLCNQGTWSPPSPPECSPVCANITSFLSTGSDEYPSLCGNITSATPFPTTSITTTATITKGPTTAEAQITNDFKCKSGQCIDEGNLCDGKPDCNDNSDESREMCGRLTCSNFTFRCDYGACLPSRVRCNGQNECFDGSDEYPSICRDVTPATRFPTSSTKINKSPSITKIPTTAEAQIAGCAVPNYPDNGKFVIGGTTVPPPGQRIPNYGVIFTECKKRFKPYPNVTYMFCNQGTWSPPSTPECSPVCSNLTSSLFIKINCTLDGTQVPCTDAVAGTVARYSCNSYSDAVYIDQPSQIIRTNGLWDGPIKYPSLCPVQKNSCVVPNYPANGKFNIGGTTVLSPGQQIPNHEVIFIACKKSFKPYPNVTNMFCNEGTWSPPTLPECLPVCSNRTSSMSTEITCTLDGMQVPCTDPVDGTVARYSCNSYYDDVSIDQPPQIICKDGSWDYQFEQCVAICGKKSAQGVTNIINANRTKKGDYPWQVGLYKTSDNDHICGGSILTERIVISAAHCVADYQGNVNPAEDYWVAAGKYYRVLGDERDKNTEQKTAIMKIYLSPRYRGIQRNFESDLALLIVQQRFKFSAFVQPICIDWRNSYEKEQLIHNNIGIVVGWGYTKEGEAPADELKQLEVPFISKAQCFDQVPPEFKPYLTRDKICAGFLERNTSVCDSDGGGGLVFYRNQTEKFYLRGIASTSPRREGSCDPRQYGAYTKVSDHLSFIQEIEIMHRERNKV